MSEINDSQMNEVKTPEEQKRSTTAEIWSWVRIIVISLVIGLGLSSVIKPTLVVGESMSTTLSDGDYLILNRLAYKVGEPEYKDIVVFNTTLPGERVLIKRVIATEGQHVIIKDNKVTVDGKVLEEEAYIHELPTTGDIDIIVPQNEIFVMGDNRINSMDSRVSQVGTVSLDDVIGKVAIRLFPMKTIED